MRVAAGLLLCLTCSACSVLSTQVRAPDSVVAAGADATPAITAVTGAHNDGDRIARAAAAVIGTAYQFGGADGGGFDCSGLAVYAYGSVGVAIPRTAAGQQQAAHPVTPQQLAPGDLVFFHMHGSGAVDHVGIYAGDGRFVHAPRAGEAVRYSRLDSDFYSRHFAGAGRFPSPPQDPP
ncbi:MAG: C40 family peptidase [Proteobacteria bacterium]|nr:C40 family peptidase [Pseudomonadota bacterium]